MDVVVLIGRILYALIFLGSGFAGHLGQTAATAAYAESRGLKNASGLVRVSGILIILGALGVIFGVWADLAALGLAAFSLIAMFLIHHFWTDQDQMQRTAEMTNFMKNLALVGGGLILFAVVAGTDVGLMITGPLFRL